MGVFSIKNCLGKKYPITGKKWEVIWDNREVMGYKWEVIGYFFPFISFSFPLIGVLWVVIRRNGFLLAFLIFEGETSKALVDGFGVVGKGHVHVDALEFGGVVLEDFYLSGHAVLRGHHGEVDLEVAHGVGVVFVWFEVCDGMGKEVASDGVVFVGGAFLAPSGFHSFHDSVRVKYCGEKWLGVSRLKMTEQS